MNTIRDIGPCIMTGFRMAELIVPEAHEPMPKRQVFLYNSLQGLKNTAAVWNATILSQPVVNEGDSAAR